MSKDNMFGAIRFSANQPVKEWLDATTIRYLLSEAVHQAETQNTHNEEWALANPVIKYVELCVTVHQVVL